MNLKSLLSFLLLVFLIQFLVFFTSTAQTVSSEAFINYKPIESTGKIPPSFIKTIEENFNKDLEFLSDVENKEELELQKEYYVKTHDLIRDVFISGHVLFNDPVSNYVNSVANIIKKENPGKFDDIDVYILKSPSVNASATGVNIVFINIGTLAYVENEAQLAFILCHEFSHIYNNDNLDGFMERNKILKGKGVYGSVSFDDRVDNLFQHRKEIEFIADSTAINFYINAGYDLNEINTAFDIIHYSYLPFFNDPFPIDFFNIDDFIIPSVFFKGKTDSISSMQNYKDIYHTHPNIFKRKQAVSRISLNYQNKTGKKFIESKEDFIAIRELTRFEQLRLQLLYKNYSDAIYLASLLLKDYKDNEYLQKIIAKSLYGLSKYRNSDESHLVTQSYSSVEGNSQQVHYLFRQLSQVQTNVLALKYVHHLLKEYPDDDQLINIRKDLIQELVYHHNISLNDFYDKQKVFEINIPNEDELSFRQLTNIQKDVKDFFLNAFCNEKEDKDLIVLFNNAEEHSKTLKEYESLSIKEKTKSDKAKNKQILNKGIDCKKGNALLFDPLVIIIGDGSMEEILETEKIRIKVDKHLSSLIKDFSEIKHISSVTTTENDIDIYNDLCTYKEMFQEILTKNRCTLIPVCNDFNLLAKNNNIQMICIPAMIKMFSWHYVMFFYDVHKGKLVYENTVSVNYLFSLSKKINKLIEKDLLILNF